MSINRELWQPAWPEGEFPSLPCPSCDARLNFDETSFVRRTSAHNQDYVDHIGIEVALSRFSGWFVCGHAKCGEPVAVAGDCTYDHGYGPAGQTITVMTLHPKMLFPGPPIIKIGENVIDEIGTVLEASYTLFWSNTNACASRLRVALELILEDWGFPAKMEEGKFLSLHHRIISWQEQYGSAQVARWLMAIKWLGNVSVHDASLSMDRVLDAYEILERLLETMYPADPQRLDELAASINQSKGKS